MAGSWGILKERKEKVRLHSCIRRTRAAQVELRPRRPATWT